MDDLKYATAAGAINYGFPVIADTVIPEILPTGVTTYEHVVSMPFNEIDGKDDLERAERLVQKAIEVRGVKVRISEVPVPVPYGSAFEGEAGAQGRHAHRVRRQIQPGLRVSAHGPIWIEVDDGKIEVIGPDFDDVPEGGITWTWAS